MTATFGIGSMTGRADPIVGFDVLTINRRIDLKAKTMEKTSQTSVEARRSFLKKAAYVAPAMIALGSLSVPAHANGSVTLNGGGGFDATQENLDSWVNGLNIGGNN